MLYILNYGFSETNTLFAWRLKKKSYHGDCPYVCRTLCFFSRLDLKPGKSFDRRPQSKQASSDIIVEWMNIKSVHQVPQLLFYADLFWIQDAINFNDRLVKGHMYPKSIVLIFERETTIMSIAPIFRGKLSFIIIKKKYIINFQNITKILMVLR